MGRESLFPDFFWYRAVVGGPAPRRERIAMKPWKSSSMSVFFTLILTTLAIFLHAVSAESIWAAGDAPAVTRWAAPDDRNRPIHSIQPQTKPLRIQKVTPSSTSRLPRLGDGPETPAGRIAIVVHQDIHDLILEGLSQYEADLAAMGYSTVELVFDSGTPEGLRASLAQLHGEPESLVGAVLVGEIPYIVFEMYDEFERDELGSPIRQFTDFPCDLFFMDLNGQWADTLDDGDIRAGNGKYDTWSGDKALEIWVCRLKAANLTGFNVSELPTDAFQAYMLASYFSKNHRYRVGSDVPTRAALVYNDDPWQYLGSDDAQALSEVFGASNVVSELDPLITTKADYLTTRIPAAPQLIFLRSHGYSEGHMFYPDDDFVTSGDYRIVNPHTPFFSLYVCSGSDFSVDNNLAGTIALSPDDAGLLAWGSTKTGGMWDDRPYYEALAQGEIFGEAFKRWYNGIVESQIYPEQFIHEWWAGMVLIGDAALKPLTDASPTGSLTVTLFPPEAASAGAKWSVDGVTWRNSGETVTGLSVLGEHTLRFSDAQGWITPQRQRVTFRQGPAQSVSSSYHAMTGTVDVAIFPQEAADAGARWSTDGGATWHPPGSPVSVPIGQYMVLFRQVTGWITPPSQSVTVQSGAVSQLQATYNPLLSADFTATLTSGKIPLTVTFADHTTDLGGAPTKWAWDFGDGGKSTSRNPVYVYRKSGSFTVSLTVTSSDGTTSVRTYSDFITAYVAPRASFTVSPVRVRAGQPVRFTDKSPGAVVSRSWSFGNGQTSSDQNPVQIYGAPGRYMARLTVNGPDGSSSTMSKLITVLR